MEITERVTNPSADVTTVSKLRALVPKIILLTLLSVALGVAQGWAAAGTYKSTNEAGFEIGLLHGALMPAALPGLVMGQRLPIYAPNNSGNPYNIGYILGINACGTVFFGAAFWQRRGGRQSRRQ
jgi:hypothetical protein